jgi:uncharacterized protein YdhG (YjbR/CyaY superfamily)
MAESKQKPSPYGNTKFLTIDQYHAAFSKAVQQQLTHMRNIIKQAAPNAQEMISYNMPAFKLNKNLVYYAANKSHIGLYPTSGPIVAFKDELKAYKTSKGAIQFAIDKPLPTDLITKIVQYRVKEDQLISTKIKRVKTCVNGHEFTKSSDCPTCPICEKAKQPKEGFMAAISAPARRALEAANITTLKQLSTHTEKEILNLHGVGKRVIDILKIELKKEGLNFKN